VQILDRDFHESRGARFLTRYGRPRLAGYGSFEEEYAALETGAVLLDLSDHAKIFVSGEDRRTFLNGLVTQKILNLQEGEGCPACFLDRHSHILAEVRILAFQEGFLLEGEPGLEGPLCERLRKFRLSSRVEVEGRGQALALLSLQGPAAGEMARAVLGTSGADLAPYGHGTADFEGTPVRLAKIPRLPLAGSLRRGRHPRRLGPPGDGEDGGGPPPLRRRPHRGDSFSRGVPAGPPLLGQGLLRRPRGGGEGPDIREPSSPADGPSGGRPSRRRGHRSAPG